MNQLRLVTRAEGLNFGKVIDAASSEPLLPVMAIDSLALAAEGLAAFRMQGWANPEAVERTLREGIVTFWSRSQQGLWTNGATSGNVLQLRRTVDGRNWTAYTDCDADSLLLDVNPIGPTCHTGTNSCFETNSVGE